MGNCVEKPNGLATTVSTRQYFCRMVWASLGIENSVSSTIGLAGAAILKGKLALTNFANQLGHFFHVMEGMGPVACLSLFSVSCC